MYVDGSSTGTMSPRSGRSGTNEISINPYEENNNDTPVSGYVQLQDTEDKDVVTIIRWRQLPQN